MKKQRITYGVYNIIEWHALIPMGKAVVKVTFSGGAITTSGITPATFTTSDPVVQYAIERSKDFKSGKIKVVRKASLNEEVEPEHNAPQKSRAESREPIENDALDGETYNAKPTEQAEAPAEAPQEEEPAEGATPEPESPAKRESEFLDKEFDNNEDAKNFLADNYGVLKSKMRTRAEILAVGKSVGVNIIFV